VTLLLHPLLVPWSRKGTPSMGRTACTEPHCLYEGVLYFFFFIHQLKLRTKVLRNGNLSSAFDVLKLNSACVLKNIWLVT
jgi:hypothetical protein